MDKDVYRIHLTDWFVIVTQSCGRSYTVYRRRYFSKTEVNYCPLSCKFRPSFTTGLLEHIDGHVDLNSNDAIFMVLNSPKVFLNFSA